MWECFTTTYLYFVCLCLLNMVSFLWSGQSIRPCRSLITRQTHMHIHTHTHTFGIRAGSDEQWGYFSGALTPAPQRASKPNMKFLWHQKTCGDSIRNSRISFWFLWLYDICFFSISVFQESFIWYIPIYTSLQLKGTMHTHFLYEIYCNEKLLFHFVLFHFIKIDKLAHDHQNQDNL